LNDDTGNNFSNSIHTLFNIFSRFNEFQPFYLEEGTPCPRLVFFPIAACKLPVLLVAEDGRMGGPACRLPDLSQCFDSPTADENGDETRGTIDDRDSSAGASGRGELEEHGGPIWGAAALQFGELPTDFQPLALQRCQGWRLSLRAQLIWDAIVKKMIIVVN
jgi:hypothetical protein